MIANTGRSRCAPSRLRYNQTWAVGSQSCLRKNKNLRLSYRQELLFAEVQRAIWRNASTRSRRTPIGLRLRAMPHAFCMRAHFEVWRARRRFLSACPPRASSDHFRSRLTHTLEVAQIARTLAATMGLNAELAEALALAHDIGHPPFGHAGEKALDRALRAHGLSFDHNLHALRIVTWFEERYPGFRGLNLTLAVREGVVKHSRDYRASDQPALAEYFLDEFPPLEAQLIDLADEIAYLTADLDDGLDSGILELDQVREASPLFRNFHDAAQNTFPGAARRSVAYEALRRVLNAFVTDLIGEVRARVNAIGAPTLSDIRRAPHRLARLSAPLEAQRISIKEFLYANLYNSAEQAHEHARAEEVVLELFEEADG